MSSGNSPYVCMECATIFPTDVERCTACGVVGKIKSTEAFRTDEE